MQYFSVSPWRLQACEPTSGISSASPILVASPHISLLLSRVEETMAVLLLAFLWMGLVSWVPSCLAGDCKGHRLVLRGPPGYVTDGPGNYSVNGNCEWLIKGLFKCLKLKLVYKNGSLMEKCFKDRKLTWEFLKKAKMLLTDERWI